MASETERRRTTILVGEDDEGIRDVLELLLADEGFGVQLAGDGETALAEALARPPDLILLDVVMPKLDALELCAAYRERGGTAPVVLVTASPPDEITTIGAACGAAAHILKPFDIDMVLETVTRLISPA